MYMCVYIYIYMCPHPIHTPLPPTPPNKAPLLPQAPLWTAPGLTPAAIGHVLQTAIAIALGYM